MSLMKCKNCKHKLIKLENRWVHFNNAIHADNDEPSELNDCQCINPDPKFKTLKEY